MRVRNKYVDIKIGNQNVRKHNFFLDTYLENFSKCQYVFNFNDSKDLSNSLYLKLDTPLNNVEYDSILSPSDFDMSITKGTLQSIKNSNNLSAIYTYTNAISFLLYEEGQWVEYQDRSILDGRRITAISFGLHTFLDTRDYNLYFSNSEIINISREDLIVTDSIYRGDDEFPYHLDVEKKWITETDGSGTHEYPVRTRLYSVGLGYTIGNIEDEIIIGDDVESVDVNVEDDFTYNFVITKAVDSGIYPNGNMYPSSLLHSKTFKIKTSIYPHNNLYAGNNLYPRAGDYKYVIMKYKGYYVNRGGEIIELDDVYTMSFYTGKEGVLTIKDKIERSDA